MEEHYVLPKGTDESKLVEERIRGLSNAVLTAEEWLSLLAAAETLLPHNGRRRVRASDLDLDSLGRKPRMRLFRAVLDAVGAADTYNASRRYVLRDWLAIVRTFSTLSLYVVPPPSLGYAVNLCKSAMDSKETMTSISIISVLSEIDIRVVRQLVSGEKLDEWSVSLGERLSEQRREGEDIQSRDDDVDPYPPDDYDDWLAASERVISIADDFYRWSGRKELDDLGNLKDLIENVDRPSEPEEDEHNESRYVRATSPANYWTLERMFEDLK